MTELVFDGPFNGSVAERVLTLWQELQMVYDMRGSSNRLTNLTLSMFFKGNDDWARFSGKAAESRSLVFVMRDICEAYSNGSERDQHRLVCLEKMCKIYDCCFRNDIFMPREEALQMLADCDHMSVHYNWLCKHSLENGRLCYKYGYQS